MLIDEEAAPFEVALDRALGTLMREDDELCREVWGALSNIDWTHENEGTASYTFRTAGDLIAAVIARGDYMDWYCSADPGVISQRVAEAMAAQGWHGKEME